MKRANADSQASSPAFLKRIGRIMNRALAAANYRFHIAAANSWRDLYNPLRSLTIQRSVTLLEEGERGAFADLQWTYRFIEMQDATLGALIERRTSAIQKLDWDIKIRDKIPAGKEEIAKRQAEALRAAYERINNLSAALEFLAMATFRGFSHLEKVEDENGDVVELAPVEQWFWVRNGLYGTWEYNKGARFGTVRGDVVPLPRFIIREVARPINRVALICFVRKGLSQKDWDGFIESYGIPAVFIVMPDNVPKDKEGDYLDAAESVAGDGRGVLPGGSDVKTVDNGARGVNPFREHIDYQDEQVVLRGTGGKLTMLSEATGIGGGATDAHVDTFDEIAKAEAAEISETLREGFDRDVLARVTPGEAAYAYFELAANEETDTGAVVEDLGKLEAVGLEVDEKWVEEKTGYPVRRKIAAPVPAAGLPVPEPREAMLLNRSPYATFRDFVRAARPGEEQESEWALFPRETGTLGIPREIMPQIQSGNRAAMVNFLRARGVDYKREMVKPADLKPTQAEFAPHKVDKAREHRGAQRALLVSSDSHVVDGHHQWLAALQDAPNQPIEIFRLKAPILQVIGLVSQMKSTATDASSIRNREDRSEALADALGVTTEILAPVSDLIESLAGDVQGERKDDAAWLASVEEAAMRLPEFFDTDHAEALAEALDSALGGAALRGARDGLQSGTDEPSDDE